MAPWTRQIAESAESVEVPSHAPGGVAQVGLDDHEFSPKRGYTTFEVGACSPQGLASIPADWRGSLHPSWALRDEQATGQRLRKYTEYSDRKNYSSQFCIKLVCIHAIGI